MTDVGYAALQIIPSFQGFQGKLESGSAGALVAAGASGGRKYGDAAGRSMASRFSSHVRTAAIAASAGLAIAGAAALKIGRDSIAEARESQKVGALTESTIKATGAAANVTAQQVGDLAGALSLKTGIDDEVIQSGANMLLTFKNIRNEAGAGNDIFDQTTKTLVDLSAAMGSEPRQAAIQLGKALNDPVKGVTALTRVGVTFTEQQKKQIGSLVESGKTMDAQKIILRELNSEFGGAAAAQATLGDKVDVAWGNIEEKLGTVLLPLLEDAERWFLRKGVPAIEGWVDAFQDKGIPAIKNFYDEAKPVAEDVLPAIGDTLGVVRDMAKEAAPYVADLAGAFHDMPKWAQTAIVGGGLAAFAGSKLGLGSLVTGGKGGGGGLLGGISKAAPLPVYVVNDLPGGTDVPGGGKPGGGLKNTALKAGGYGLAAAAVGYMGYEGYQAAGNAFQGATAPGGGFVPSGGAGAMGSSGSGPSQADLAMFDKQIAFQKALESAATDGNLAKMVSLYERYENVLGATVTRQLTASDANAVFADKFDQSLTEFSAKFKTLPKKLQTDIVLKGIPESRKAAADLARQYHLTEGQRNTLFRALGIPQAKEQTVGLLEMYNRARSPVQGHISVDTSAAEAALNRVLNLMNAINRRGNVPSAPGVLPGEAGRTAAPRTPARPRPIRLHVGEREFNAYLDERIGSNDDLIQERNRAGGSR